MAIILSFAVFIGAMILCIFTGYTMVIALFIGLIAFIICGLKKGFKLGELVNMSKSGSKDALVVVKVLFTIGFITAVWRASGTIALFVYYGMRVITFNLFLIVTFILACLLSYALGTSFGVAGTVGVIFMALARSGGVNPVITAAVVMSGIYFGDRGSPVSSSATLVAVITKTNLLDNVKRMAKTAIVPFFIALVLYGVLSFANPIHGVDNTFMTSLRSEFNISLWCVIPALCMLILPLFKVSVLHAMWASIISGMIVSVSLEHMSLMSLIKGMFFGYVSEGTLGNIMNGGGLISMIEVVAIVGISSTYSGIFGGTQMLHGLQDKIRGLMNKVGRFPSMVIMSVITLSIFCNQTIATMMCNDIMKKPYKDSGATKEELALDMENSVILLAGMVPWAIACSVPLAFMQVGYEAVPLAVFLYLVPLCYGVQKKMKLNVWEAERGHER